ncbi:Hsp20/alpha crystallin family protein [Patescibacteria group bacterium]|nr:Hsp20/alpha crystallin family protein [Patescibacteria group bacterium]MBU2220160.1 Hsp20/alpha crystallin family protein [Patescibacteria group bacterium]MBU2264667.1 Hsp20/alpha crystallin family protein [Patescibacteria group bacterium]
MNKKPSFLERLTGVLEDEENAKDVQINGPEEEEEDDKEEEKESEKEKAKPSPQFSSSRKSESETNETGKKDKKISLPANQEKAAEEWLPDSEGQLTIDVYQTPADIVIKSTIAGVSPEDLDITITNDMVTIKGKREKDEVITGGDYYYQECYWGAFSRSVILPVDVEAEKAEASMKNGILTIRLPKIEKIKTKKIRVISS